MAVFQASTPAFEQSLTFDKDSQPEVQSFGDSSTLQPGDPKSSNFNTVLGWRSCPVSGLPQQSSTSPETTVTDQYAFAFDIDGVLIRGGDPIPEAIEATRVLNGKNEYGIEV